MPLISLFFISFFFSWAESNQAKRVCTLNGLSDNCRFFQDNRDKAEFVMADGSRFANPFYDPQRPAVPPAEAVGQNAAKMEERALEAQASLLARSDLGSHERFRLALTSKMTLATIGSFSTLPEVPAAAFLVLPWPPPAFSQVQSVPFRDFKDKYLDQLPKVARDELLEHARALKALSQGGMNYSAESQIASPQVDKAALGQRALRAFEKAKSLMLQEILKGRSPSALSSDEVLLYEKVNSVRFEGVDFGETLGCKNTPVNAFYSSYSHQVQVCSTLANYPEAQLVAILGHELGHAIDPCVCHKHLHRINTSSLQGEPGEELAQEIAANPSKRAVYQDLRDQVLRGETLRLLHEADSNSELQRWAESRGLTSPIVRGFPLDRYPQREVLACLFEQGGLRDLTREEIIEIARLTNRYYVSVSGEQQTSHQRLESEAKLVADLRRLPRSCIVTSTHMSSNSSELMADYWGSRVLGRYLEQNPAQTQLEKIAALSFFAPNACKDQSLGPGLAGFHSFQGHLLNRERIDRVYLADPRTQRAMGCAPDPSNGTACFQKDRVVGFPSGVTSRAGQR